MYCLKKTLWGIIVSYLDDFLNREKQMAAKVFFGY